MVLFKAIAYDSGRDIVRFKDDGKNEVYVDVQKVFLKGPIKIKEYGEEIEFEDVSSLDLTTLPIIDLKYGNLFIGKPLKTEEDLSLEDCCVIREIKSSTFKHTPVYMKRCFKDFEEKKLWWKKVQTISYFVNVIISKDDAVSINSFTFHLQTDHIRVVLCGTLSPKIWEPYLREKVDDFFRLGAVSIDVRGRNIELMFDINKADVFYEYEKQISTLGTTFINQLNNSMLGNSCICSIPYIRADKCIDFQNVLTALPEWNFADRLLECIYANDVHEKYNFYYSSFISDGYLFYRIEFKPKTFPDLKLLTNFYDELEDISEKNKVKILYGDGKEVLMCLNLSR